MRKVAAVLTVALLALTGCRFEKHSSDDGKNSNVKFATPFGGMSVKTDDKSAQANVGLSAYPGAVLSHKDEDGHEDGAADINMSFGNFHLGVRALSYQTADTPDKVLAFYRKDMARYGSIVLCRGHQPVGQPVRTQDGLTCDTDKSGVHNDDGDGEQQELKAGSKQHQHIVSVEPRNGGTKIALVALDLPGNLGGEDSKD